MTTNIPTSSDSSTSTLRAKSLNGINRKAESTTEPDSLPTAESTHPKIWELRGRAITDAESAMERQAANDSMRRQAADAAATEEPERTIREHIHECFEFVAMGYACTLAMLLTETRKRNIDDDDVREVISDEETDLSHCGSDDRKFRCCGSRGGVLFIERTNGVVNRLASAYELFSEFYEFYDLEDSGKSADVNRKTPFYVLSDELRERGEELTELEAVVIDVAQALHKRFKNGAGVSPRQLRRVTARYHGLSMDEIKETAQHLAGRGLCRLDGQGFNLVKHFGKSVTVVPSKFAKLTRTGEQEQLLLACNSAITFFESRNIASFAAVEALMQARHDVGKVHVACFIRELLNAEVLDSVELCGTPGLRLTKPAIRLLKGEVGTLTEVTEAAQMTEDCCCTAIFGT